MSPFAPLKDVLSRSERRHWPSPDRGPLPHQIAQCQKSDSRKIDNPIQIGNKTSTFISSPPGRHIPGRHIPGRHIPGIARHVEVVLRFSFFPPSSTIPYGRCTSFPPRTPRIAGWHYRLRIIRPLRHQLLRQRQRFVLQLGLLRTLRFQQHVRQQFHQHLRQRQLIRRRGYVEQRGPRLSQHGESHCEIE